MAVIAGKVAPRFMGEYNASTTYQFYDAVTYGNKLYFCKTSGTVGKTPSGATDNYWFLSIDGTFADATKLGGETAEQWQTKIDNIQTTSSAGLSQAGWYRVAELGGQYTNSCELSFGSVFSNAAPEVHVVRFDNSYNKHRISGISHNSARDIRVFTKLRSTYDGTKTYLEVYYALSVGNTCKFVLLSGVNFSGAWKAITPTLTSETVDGVTVTTTYDIPANASPVTDLDLAQVDGTELLSSSVLEKAISITEDGIYNFKFSGSTSATNADLPKEGYANGSATVIVRKGTSTHEGTEVILWGSNTFGCQSIVTNHRASNGTWLGWKTLATTADLANYLPLTGGKINGQLTIENTTADTGTTLEISNALRKIYIQAQKTGAFRIYDSTNGKAIISSSSSGNTVIFEGTATGNLPLTGGTIASTNAAPLTLDATGSDGRTLLMFRNKDSNWGSLGFEDLGVPVYHTATGASNTLLHTGNSAKVAIQSSAPTDTTSAWLDTSNKKTKAYIDGAWTVIA